MVHLIAILIRLANTIIPWIVGAEILGKGFMEGLELFVTFNIVGASTIGLGAVRPMQIGTRCLNPESHDFSRGSMSNLRSGQRNLTHRPRALSKLQATYRKDGA